MLVIVHGVGMGAGTASGVTHASKGGVLYTVPPTLEYELPRSMQFEASVPPEPFEAEVKTP